MKSHPYLLSDLLSVTDCKYSECCFMFHCGITDNKSDG